MTQPPDPSAPLSQEQFGPYIVYERIGVGGMATVHRAKQHGIEGIERIVALKRLLPHLAEDATFIKSFVREAKLALMLQHANVVQLFELGKVGSVYFIAMEYIDGRDIRRILRQARKASGPPTINVTLSLLIQTCEALEYAHTKTTDDGEPLGLVHRDVSPSNLMVTRSGHVKVIDFGIAKAQSQQLRTQTGRVKGKLAYMAPEAIAGRELDARSDLFSVGVIAHELLTARPLFASKNEYQTLLNVQKSDILPPSAFNQAVPPELDAIVLKALARDPDARYSSAAELRDDLHAVRIRYQLSSTNREVQAWCDWAFALEVPGGNFSGPVVTDSLAGVSRSPVPLKTPLPQVGVPRAVTDASARVVMRAKSQSGRSAGEEEEAADVAWGGHEHDTGQPVIIEDVPDYSRHPGAATAAGAAMQTAVDADDVTASTLIGVMAPGASQPRPTSFPHGSSADAVPQQRTTMRGAAVAPPAGAVEVPLDDSTARNERLSAPQFGASIVGREAPARSFPWKPIAALLAVAAIAAAVYVGMARRSEGPAKAAPPAEPAVAAVRAGTLKFIVEPADATIKIAGLDAHAGAPWSVQLDPGVIQVKISHADYQSWETSVELSSAETQTIRVVLAAAQAGPDANLATLSLDSDPSGLTVLLDGKELEAKTPIKQSIEPGPHNIALRQSGEVLWRQHFVAEARTLYEFAPSMSEIKRREREEREARAHENRNARPSPIVEPAWGKGEPPAPGSTVPSAGIVAPFPGSGSAAVARPAGSATPGSATPSGSGSAVKPAPGSGSVAVAPPAGSGSAKAGAVDPFGQPLPPSKPTPVPAPAPAPIPAPRTGPPILIPPNAVKRTSGELPRISTITRPGQEVPAMVTAKICIDAAGAVTNVTILKLSGDVASKLAAAIKTWRFTPHKLDGKPTPACFVNPFALK